MVRTIRGTPSAEAPMQLVDDHTTPENPVARLWVMRLRPRRIPGTLALALTNLMAAHILIAPEEMEDNPLHRVALQIMPVTAWGSLFLACAIGLVMAAASLRSVLLHVFGAFSLAGWVGICVGGFLSDITDDSFNLSGLAVALFTWMLLGPHAMILVPLVWKQKGDPLK